MRDTPTGLRGASSLHALRDASSRPIEPDPIPEEEALQVQVRASIFGSRPVTETAEEFMSKVRGFHVHTTMRVNGQRAGMNSKESTREMIAYRQQASDLLKKVEPLMREELENL